MIYREATLKDAEGMANLYKIDFWQHILSFRGQLSKPKKIEKEIKCRKKKWLLVENDSNIIGCSAIEVFDWNKGAEFQRFVTKKEMRGNGIAKEMCRTLIFDVAQPIGVKYGFAWARAQEYGMQNVLEYCGFTPKGFDFPFYVNHNGREVRENFVYYSRPLNGGEKELESFDNLTPAVKAIKDAIEKYSGEYGHRNKD